VLPLRCVDANKRPKRSLTQCLDALVDDTLMCGDNQVTA
jgi:hypothetical protein